MQIIHNKEYKIEPETKEFNFISYNSKGTLSIVMEDGTHYNFHRDELVKMIKFIKELNFEFERKSVNGK
jgi:hypothetical protein